MAVLDLDPRSRVLALVAGVVLLTGCASSGGAAASAAASARSSPSPSGAPSPAASIATSIESAFAAAHAVGETNPILAGVGPREADAIGQATFWDGQGTADGFRLVYTVGWGDCMAGCINSHEFTYDVTQAGDVKLVKDSGDPIPPDVVKKLEQDASTNVVHQGLVGRVVAGPVCPVEKANDPACAPRPVPGAVLVLRGSDGSEVARIQADERGLFGMELAPGDYVLEPQPVQGLMGTAGSVALHVDDGRATVLEIAYDTGIR